MKHDEMERSSYFKEKNVQCALLLEDDEYIMLNTSFMRKEKEKCFVE